VDKRKGGGREKGRRKKARRGKIKREWRGRMEDKRKRKA
jgi:hypothetical protein